MKVRCVLCGLVYELAALSAPCPNSQDLVGNHWPDTFTSDGTAIPHDAYLAAKGKA